MILQVVETDFNTKEQNPLQTSSNSNIEELSSIKMIDFYRNHVLDKIDKIFYINLDRRIDRRIEVERELKNLGIPENKVERYSAVETRPGYVGCAISHLNVVKICRERGYNTVLILEDDFLPVVTPFKFFQNLSIVFDLNLNFHGLLLAHNVHEMKNYNSFLGRCVRVATASAYILTRPAFDRYIEVVGRGADNLIKTLIQERYVNDVVWCELMNESLWLFFLERLSIQRPSYSDNCESFQNYGL